MARVVWYWRQAFEKCGHEFQHIGTQEIGPLPHVRHFPEAAYHYYKKVNWKADVFLVHEPAAGFFSKRGIQNIVVSHGLERRAWSLASHSDLPRPSLKSRLLFPLWRLRGCDLGLRRAAGALLINQEDWSFARKHYGLIDSKICVFKNGADLGSGGIEPVESDQRNVLFIGSWLARKGIHTMSRAAKFLHDAGVRLRWVLAGTGASQEQVLADWPKCLHPQTVVIPRFCGPEEADLYRQNNIFLLPSFFEGQPLALLQAMAYSRCCITTNNSGQRDIIQNRINGLLFDAGDAVALANLLKEATQNLNLQTMLGVNARQSVENRSWTSVSQEVVDFVLASVTKPSA